LDYAIKEAKVDVLLSASQAKFRSIDIAAESYYICLHLAENLKEVIWLMVIKKALLIL